MKELFQKLYKKSANEFYGVVEKNLKSNQRMFIVTANPETFIYSETENDFKELLLDDATTLIPDGIGIVKAANILGFNIKERITGIDLASKILEICNKNSFKIALLGARPEVLEALSNIIKNNYKNIKIVAKEDGYQDDKDKFFEKIKSRKPDVCLVALGIPFQEKIIYKHLKDFEKGIFVGVGGSFDVLSGKKKRAPVLFQKLNIEWLYRIVKEPSRLKRFYSNNVKFLFKIKKMKNK